MPAALFFKKPIHATLLPPAGRTSGERFHHMKQMMERAGNGHLLTVLSYPGAGHLIEPPYSPHIKASNFMTQGKEKVLVLWGGETGQHSHAQEDSWKKTLHFLEEHLYTGVAAATAASHL